MASGTSERQNWRVKMATRNNFVTNLSHKLQQDSVGWGSLMLWIAGLVVLLAIVTMFSST